MERKRLGGKVAALVNGAWPPTFVAPDEAKRRSGAYWPHALPNWNASGPRTALRASGATTRGDLGLMQQDPTHGLPRALRGYTRCGSSSLSHGERVGVRGYGLSDRVDP
jgi:hypothetical protein